MKNKEQLLYFFLNGKISLSQYDYKFMANLQTMIQNLNRVTSNQAVLFDNLISKYKKQLTKHGLEKDELKALAWKTEVVDSTPEYTGSIITIVDDKIQLRVPFNKNFITAFRQVEDNQFDWDKERKIYIAPFNTTSLRLATTFPKEHFTSMKLCPQSQRLLDEISKYESTYWKPTLTKINGRLMVVAVNSILAEKIADIDLELTPKTLFLLSNLGVEVADDLVKDDPKLEFAANRQYEIEVTDIENTIMWMKNIGCENVVIGRGLRTSTITISIADLVQKYGMNCLGPMTFGSLPDGVSMLIQHTSNIETRNGFTGTISKTVVIKDSRPIEVK